MFGVMQLVLVTERASLRLLKLPGGLNARLRVGSSAPYLHMLSLRTAAGSPDGL